MRYIRHTLETEYVSRHIASGKQCTRLAMSWADNISFVVTESLSIKRLAPLGVIKENTNTTAQNDNKRFDSDFLLMAGELAAMFSDMVAALGGEQAEQKDLVTEGAKVAA